MYKIYGTHFTTRFTTLIAQTSDKELAERTFCAIAASGQWILVSIEN